MGPRTIRHIVLAVVAIICGGLAAYYTPKPLPEISHESMLQEARAGRIKRIRVDDEQVIVGASTALGEFRSPFKKSDDSKFLDELRALGVEVVFEESSGLIP